VVRRLGRVIALVTAASLVYVAGQAAATLRTLDTVERERDAWQRPDDILRQLNVGAGSTVVDLGSGAGYFALKIAARVTPGGRVLAVDLRRESLAFLWMRALLQGSWNVRVIHGDSDDPKLPPGLVDAVLIANTLHELTAPRPILTRLWTVLRADGRLVVVDRAVRGEAEGHHELDASTAEREMTAQGFQTVSRDPRFIDRPGDEDIWWMLVFRKR